jgi:hypothetical protein
MYMASILYFQFHLLLFKIEKLVIKFINNQKSKDMVNERGPIESGP